MDVTAQSLALDGLGRGVDPLPHADRTSARQKTRMNVLEAPIMASTQRKIFALVFDEMAIARSPVDGDGLLVAAYIVKPLNRMRPTFLVCA
jgi:hypothetical protein